MRDTARLLFPAIRWSRDDESFEGYRDAIEHGLALGVGGFIVFGGTAAAVRELTAELRQRSPHPLLIGADLERGAGQQFAGATSLPPAAALAELDDLVVTRRAGELTAREALAMGVNWVYAPVADLDVEPENPIVGSRSFGGDPDAVSRHVRAWIEGCRDGGALACAKHFPGHGRTTTDSHLALPLVRAEADVLGAEDLAPFRAAVEAGVDSVMTAHVAYPALDASGVAATLSRPILTGLLRGRLGFDGLVVTDALIMEGVLGGGEDAATAEADAAVRALAAGCDALLYPRHVDAVVEALERARTGAVPDGRIARAAARVAAAAERVSERTGARAAETDPTRLWGRDGDAEWARNVALRAVRRVRGRPSCPPAVEVLVVDDDVGGPFPVVAPRGELAAGLRAAGVDAVAVPAPTGKRPVLVALFADIRGFKGRPGLSEAALETVASAIAAPLGATVVLFGPPRIAEDAPGAHVLLAWGGEPIMQRAAADWLTRHSRREA